MVFLLVKGRTNTPAVGVALEHAQAIKADACGTRVKRTNLIACLPTEAKIEAITI
jgi:hypothetical protein